MNTGLPHYVQQDQNPDSGCDMWTAPVGLGILCYFLKLSLLLKLVLNKSMKMHMATAQFFCYWLSPASLLVGVNSDSSFAPFKAVRALKEKRLYFHWW